MTMLKIPKFPFIALLIFIPLSLKSSKAQENTFNFPIHLMGLNPYEQRLVEGTCSTCAPKDLVSQSFFAAQESIANLEVDEKITQLKNRFARRKISTVIALRTAVAYLHKNYLVEYREFSTLQATLDSGIFNCLTGVSLMSMVLDTQGIAYRIMATDNHVFLLADINSNSVLIEVTDKNNPVVDYSRGIDEALNRYTQTSDSKKIIQIGDQSNKMGLLSLFYLNKTLLYSKANRDDKAISNAIKYLYFSFLANVKPKPVIDFLILERQARKAEIQELLSYRDMVILP